MEKQQYATLGTLSLEKECHMGLKKKTVFEIGLP
jgi:hypothetical protein